MGAVVVGDVVGAAVVGNAVGAAVVGDVDGTGVVGDVVGPGVVGEIDGDPVPIAHWVVHWLMHWLVHCRVLVGAVVGAVVGALVTGRTGMRVTTPYGSALYPIAISTVKLHPEPSSADCIFSSKLSHSEAIWLRSVSHSARECGSISTCRTPAFTTAA